MKKILFVFLVLSLFCISASAKINLILPIEESNIADKEINLGLIAPGESFSFTVSSDSGFGDLDRWTNAAIVESSLPAGWTFENAVPYGLTLSVKVNSNPKSTEDVYSFKVKLFNETRKIEPEFFTLVISLKNDLQKASVSSSLASTVVGSPVSYDLILINDSLADHSFYISSDLPAGWIESKSFFVEAGKQKAFSFSVTPLVYGSRDFTLTVKSKINESIIAVIPLKVEAKPTLRGKYAVGLQGYSFFTPTLAPFYALNALIAEFLFG